MKAVQKRVKTNRRKYWLSPEQELLARNHGTPKQFEKALLKAYFDLFIGFEGACEAIRKYRIEFGEAGRKAGTK